MINKSWIAKKILFLVIFILVTTSLAGCYALVQMLHINNEIKVIVKNNLPLTKIISEISNLQMQQSILIERAGRIIYQKDNEKLVLTISDFNNIGQRVDEELSYGIRILSDTVSLSNSNSVRASFQPFLENFKNIQKAHQEFEVASRTYLSMLQDSSVNENAMRHFEENLIRQEEALNDELYTNLMRSELITEESTLRAQRHEEFGFWMLLGILSFSLFAGALFSLRLIRSIVHPIQYAIQTAERIANGERDIEIESISIGEVGVLINSLNQMLDKIKSHEARLENEARVDGLTGLLNRKGFLEAAARMQKLAIRNKKVLCIGFLDVNKFKAINDTYGHKAGDKVLIDLSMLIKESMRESDICCRYAGDEFVCLLYDADELMARKVFARLKSSIDIHNENSPEDYSFSVSVGAAMLKEEDNLDEVIARADEIMYKDKASRD